MFLAFCDTFLFIIYFLKEKKNSVLIEIKRYTTINQTEKQIGNVKYFRKTVVFSWNSITDFFMHEDKWKFTFLFSIVYIYSLLFK